MGGVFSATFIKPAQSVVYMFYVQNLGEYDAYLNSIYFKNLDNGTYKKCSATTTDSTKATDSLVQASCEGINVEVVVSATNYGIGAHDIPGHLLIKQSAEKVVVKIGYSAAATYVDGPFKVEFGDLKFSYSTVDTAADLISFTIDEKFYQAEDGMTWEEWVNSSYNTSGFKLSDNNIVASNKYFHIFYSDYFTYVDKSSIISSTEKYCLLGGPL